MYILLDTLMVLYNVYTLGYPDGFIQCIILAIQYIPLGGYTNNTNNSIYSIRWGTIFNQHIEFIQFATILQHKQQRQIKCHPMFRITMGAFPHIQNIFL